jgi:peptidyl-prolyl cis-trans isomerase A (cyclophilin A)
MASAVQRKAAIRAARQRAARRRMYMLAGLAIAVIAIGVGAYVYFSGRQPPPSTTAPDIVHAQISTTQGVMQVELYRSLAPTTVNNFVNLANSHFYDNLVWHRIIKGFVIQAGDPTTKNGGGTNSTWGNNGSNQTIPLEINPSLHNYEGYLAMARHGDPDINSASSQFFINLVDNSGKLDPNSGTQGYAVFGKVTSGMDVALAIGNLPTTGSSPPSGSGADVPYKPYPLVTSIAITG